MLLNNFISKIPTKILLFSILSLFCYLFFGYDLIRTNFTKLLLLYFALFCFFYKIIQISKDNILLLTFLSILFRFVFLFSIPNLSQDFYRFIWDGRMLFEGLNPYLYLPENFINQQKFPVHQAVELYTGMGEFNGSHYTNYPPLNQLSFFITALFAGKSILGSVIVLRVQLILADIGIIYFGKKILEKLHLPIHYIFLYALNPFIIIELTGNLHFEPVMLFFLIWSMSALLNDTFVLAGILLACSISIKLIPLLFLPLFYQWFMKRSVFASKTEHVNNDNMSFLQRQKSKQRLLWIHVSAGMTRLFRFYAIVITTILLFFLPFYSSELIDNYFNSVGLWFLNFEFNASFYYIFKKIGSLFRGYNEIAIIGKIIPVLTIVFLGWITFFRKNSSPKELITGLLFGLSFYYFTTTTMHPWYLATLILLSVLQNIVSRLFGVW